MEESLAIQPETETLAAHSVKVSKQRPPPAAEEAPMVLVEMELCRQLIGLEKDIEAIKARLDDGKKRS